MDVRQGLATIVLRVDNVCFALVKGFAVDPRSGKTVSAYRRLLDGGEYRVHVAYVDADRSHPGYGLQSPAAGRAPQ